MKNSIVILSCLLTLLLVGITGAVFSTVDLMAVAKEAPSYVHYAAILPVGIMSASITPEILQDLKLKFGTLKIITVVVEPEEYDIDNLSFSDLIFLKGLGIDTYTLKNKDLSIAERLDSVNAFLNKQGDNLEMTKEKVREIASGKITFKGESYQFVVKRPDKGLIKMLLPLAEQKKIEEFAEKGVKNLVVGGDMDALDDGIVYMGVVSQLKELIAPSAAFLSRA